MRHTVLEGKKVLELHRHTKGEPYYLGFFLVGAYQEILGDMHNLFGDTHAVHLFVDEDGQVDIDRVIEGDTVETVAGYVQYERKDLVHRVRKATERSIRAGPRFLGESAAGPMVCLAGLH